MSIDTHSQILQEISYYAGILLFLSRNSKVHGKSTVKTFPLKSSLQMQIQPYLFATLGHFQTFARSLPFFLLPPWEVFLVNAHFLLCSASSCGTGLQWMRTLEWLRDAPYSWKDDLHTGTWGDLPNETKLAEVNEEGFVLTEFPE